MVSWHSAGVEPDHNDHDQGWKAVAMGRIRRKKFSGNHSTSRTYSWAAIRFLQLLLLNYAGLLGAAQRWQYHRGQQLRESPFWLRR